MAEIPGRPKAIDWHVKEYDMLDPNQRRRLRENISHNDRFALRIDEDFLEHGTHYVLMAGKQPFGYVECEGNPREGYTIDNIFVGTDFRLRRDFVRRFNRAPSEELIAHVIDNINNPTNVISTSPLLEGARAIVKRMKRAYPQLVVRTSSVDEEEKDESIHHIDYSAIAEKIRPVLRMRVE